MYPQEYSDHPFLERLCHDLHNNYGICIPTLRKDHSKEMLREIKRYVAKVISYEDLLNFTKERMI